MFRRARPWLISLLVHALLFAGFWQLRVPAPTVQKTPLAVSLWQATAPSHPDVNPTPAELATPPEQNRAAITSTPSKPPIETAKPAPSSRATATRQIRQPPAPKSIPATSVGNGATKDSAPTTMTVPQSTGSLFDRATSYLQSQQQRELTASELQAVSTRSASKQPRSIAQQHQAALTAGGMASNVQDVLDDGRHIVKVGQRCFVASANTDLLKDPLSAKGVACEQPTSAADELDRILEQRRNRHVNSDERPRR